MTFPGERSDGAELGERRTGMRLRRERGAGAEIRREHGGRAKVRGKRGAGLGVRADGVPHCAPSGTAVLPHARHAGRITVWPQRWPRPGFDRFEWLIVAVVCAATGLGVLAMTGSPVFALALGLLMLVVTVVVVAMI